MHEPIDGKHEQYMDQFWEINVAIVIDMCGGKYNVHKPV